MIHLWSWLQVGIDVHATLRLAAKEPLVQITVSRMFFYIYEHFWVSRSSTYWRESRRRTRIWVQLRVRGGHWLFIHVTKGSSQEQTLHFYFFDLSEQYYYMQVILFSLFFFWNLPKKIIFPQVNKPRNVLNGCSPTSYTMELMDGDMEWESSKVCKLNLPWNRTSAEYN